MPFDNERVDPETFLSEYKGVVVYVAYKNDELDTPLYYWFNLSKEATHEAAFDIRGLDAWRSFWNDRPRSNRHRPTEDEMRAVLMLAIDRGEIRPTP